MKNYKLGIAMLFLMISCTNLKKEKNNHNMKESVKIYEALKTAHTDAEKAYSDLTIYDVTISSEDGNWKIDYEVRNKNHQGGGPHYVISSKTGEIVSKRYEQ